MTCSRGYFGFAAPLTPTRTGRGNQWNYRIWMNSCVVRAKGSAPLISCDLFQRENDFQWWLLFTSFQSVINHHFLCSLLLLRCHNHIFVRCTYIQIKHKFLIMNINRFSPLKMRCMRTHCKQRMYNIKTINK